MSKIFLVEDDQYVSRVYERAFRLGGHEIEILPDGESAWSALSAAGTLPDVIILDIALPKMSGLELLGNIRKELRFGGVPIAVLSNSFDEDMEKKSLAAGANLFLIKIDHKPEELLGKIQALINKT